MIRDFNGYRQHQTSYELFDKKTQSWKLKKQWVFYVTGFCFDDVSCHVLKTDSSEQRVPIDNKDRILINGKWYGQQFWEH